LIRSVARNKELLERPDRLMVEIGRYFVGASYKAGTLEGTKTEHLVVDLREFDCMTFVENVLALALHIASKGQSFEGFLRFLRKIRYRSGRIHGYSSRLHYFSDWIYDNQRKGILKDITAEIGGKLLQKSIHFMTTHPHLYPPLEDRANLRKMKSVESAISQRSIFFLPRELLRRREDRISNGDLIGITARGEGLDVLHAGVAVRTGKRIHLLHASSREGKVVLSRKTLYRYLAESKARSGIMVARPQFRRSKSHR